jgi:hypothetical protein
MPFQVWFDGSHSEEFKSSSIDNTLDFTNQQRTRLLAHGEIVEAGDTGCEKQAWTNDCINGFHLWTE